jgi:hypothetical protein
MKKKNSAGLCLMLAIFLAPGLLFGQSCERGSVNLGTITAHWIYHSPDLRIQLQLPDGWFVYDYLSSPKKYLRVGSNYFRISMGLSEMSDGSLMDLDQLKKLPLNYAPILLSVAKLQDTTAVIPSEEDSVRNHSFSMRLFFADPADEGQFLLGYCKMLSGHSPDSSAVRDTLIGSFRFRSVVIQGGKEQHLLAVKNFGCVQVLLRFTYEEAGDLAEMLDICKGLTSTP